MNHSVRNWNMEMNHLLPPQENQKRSMGLLDNNEFVELLWQNGQVVQHSQTHRKPGPAHNDSEPKKKYVHPMKDGDSYMNLSTLIEEDETASWIQYPLEDSLDAEFCSNFLYELSNAHPIEKEKTIKHFEGEKYVKFGASEETNVLTTSSTRPQQPLFRQPTNPIFVENSIPSSRPKVTDATQKDLSLEGLDRVGNFPHFSRPLKAENGLSNGRIRGSGSGLVSGGDFGESSVMTIGSSHCGSNQLPNETDLSRVSSNGVGSTGMFQGPVKEDTRKVFPQSERGLTETLETNITSSSGGSGGSFIGTDRQSASIHSHKRKGRDADESEYHSEDAEFESANANKAPPRSGSIRRSRAAEVHNLSERRRRDRINEKMRALQELIPHCNKSDKASMLDEAIEYLKSLQLQVQMMWMGGGMAPMMFPGVQHYISRMGMGMGTHHSMPSIHSPMQLPRLPLVNQTIPALSPNQPPTCPSVLNGVNFQNRMQNTDFSLSYARHMGFHHMQTPQSLNIFGYGSQIAQQSPKVGLPSSSSATCHGGTPVDNAPSSKLG